MPLTVEQKKIINTFKRIYFERDPFNRSKIPLSDFMSKNRQQQLNFIKTWAQGRYNKMVDLEAQLLKQQNKVQTEKTNIKKALLDWGVVIN